MESLEREVQLKRILAEARPVEAPDGVWEFELYLGSYADAFETMVPLPLPYRNINPDIVAYVEEQMGEIPEKRRARMVLRLPPEVIQPGDEETVRTLLSVYFAQRSRRFIREEREALRSVFVSLFWGFVFMLFCQVVRWLADFPDHPTITQTISEGMLVLGWVALWNPYDRFLFTWWPAVRRRRLVSRIEKLEVVLRPSGMVCQEKAFGRGR